MGAPQLVVGAGPAHAFSTFTVNQTGDQADADLTDNVCDTNLNTLPRGLQCTLRAAIQEANDTARADTINFRIGGPSATGVKTISPNSALPQIDEAVTINGYSQPGASPNTLAKGSDAVLLIELNGSGAGENSRGLLIGSSASNTVVRGLVINRFGLGGIVIDSNGNNVEGNFIGTDPSGTEARGNGSDGVFSNSGSDNVIGGASPDKRNLISGNDKHGIRMGGSATGNEIVGNLIGTDKDGTNSNLGNLGSGVLSTGADNAIGGAGSAAANTIAFNGLDGVIISTATTSNTILRNSIFSNGALGIDLIGVFGPDPNDGGTADDADTGANGLQNKPALTSAITSGGTTTINGVLDTKPNTSYLIQFFRQPNGNEGKTFIGQKQVPTDADGRVTFSFSPASAVAVGQKITATATGPEGTSEFSAPRGVTAS